MNIRFPKTAGIALLAVAALAATGCSGGSPVSDPPATATDTPVLVCEGVRVVVDPGDLEGAAVDTCLEVDAPLTAIDAFQQAGVDLEGVSTSDMFFACRIDGQPEAGITLEYDGETYSSGDCADFGPVWAWWGLFADAGAGWEFAQEGAESLEVAPGEAVAFAFQFGDTIEPRLPLQ